MNDGNTIAGYIPFDPISSDTPKEHEPMNPSDMNEAEMREFFAKIASAVVNASEQAKVIEAIRAQQVEDHARLYNLESLVSTHLQTIDALREQVRETASERDDAKNVYDIQSRVIKELESEVTNLLAGNTKRGATIHEHEMTIHQLHARILELENQIIVATHLNTNQAVSIEHYQKRNLELESASKAAQQTIVDLQHTVYNVREELRGVKEDQAVEVAQNEAHKAHIIEQATMLEHYETQLDQVRKALA